VVDLRSIVGSNIRHYRKIKGLSQDQFAEICGFHYSYIGGVERGERNISLDNLEKIANALHVEPKVLFEGHMPVQQANIDEKDTAIDELLAILQAKDVQYIQMTKKLVVEIFKTFPKQRLGHN